MHTGRAATSRLTKLLGVDSRSIGARQAIKRTLELSTRIRYHVRLYDLAPNDSGGKGDPDCAEDYTQSGGGRIKSQNDIPEVSIVRAIASSNQKRGWVDQGAG